MRAGSENIFFFKKKKKNFYKKSKIEKGLLVRSYRFSSLFISFLIRLSFLTVGYPAPAKFPTKRVYIRLCARLS